MSALPQEIQDEIHHPIYDQIMLHAKGDPNDYILAVILSSWLNKKGVLPQYMGLTVSDFNELVNTHFPGFRVNERVRQDEEYSIERVPEVEDLLKLFNAHRANLNRSELWVSQIITAACLGANHLWQDLGLWNRNQLTNLISYNFPSLAEKNNKNMKWKKFLYKQLCNEEGIFTCRSPSCEICIDYAVCFGPEE